MAVYKVAFYAKFLKMASLLSTLYIQRHGFFHAKQRYCENAVEGLCFFFLILKMA